MRWFRVAAVAGLGALLVGCGSNDSASPPAGGGASSASSTTLSGTITVLAAASLTESFTELGKQFEAAHPGVTVKFSYGASSTLATQIVNGAPADVFASASTSNMDQVVKAGEASDPATFAKNVLEIAVPPDNPAKIATLADLAKPGVKVAVCEPQVPCGKVAAKVFENAKVTVKPVTLGQDVKAVLTAVRTGEVDAGLVYLTDVKSAGTAVTGVEIPTGQNASTDYPIAVTKASKNTAVAQAFVDYVKSADGQALLGKAGFASP
jgi:molybdate transport system substrate-binding protein